MESDQNWDRSQGDVYKRQSVYSREATKFDEVVMKTANIEKITENMM